MHNESPLVGTSVDLLKPIHDILNKAELLLAAELPAGARELGDAIRRAAIELLGRVQDETERRQLEAGTVPKSNDELCLHELLRDAGNEILCEAQRAGIEFKLKLSRQLPNRIIGDARQLRVVVMELAQCLLAAGTRGTAEIEAFGTSGVTGSRFIRLAATRVDETGAILVVEPPQVLLRRLQLLGGEIEKPFDQVRPSLLALAIPFQPLGDGLTPTAHGDIFSRTLDPSVIEVLRPFQELGEQNIFAELTNDFLSVGTELLDRIRFAIATGETKLAAHEAYNLKTSAASMGAQRLSVLCARAEHLAREGAITALAAVATEIERELTQAGAELQKLAAQFSERQLCGCRILVIDDEPDIVDLLGTSLRERGAAVLSAPDGNSGLQLARSHSLDAIVSDFAMPRLNGVELLQKLRSERVKAPPFFLISGHFGFSKSEADSVGASGLFPKPLDEDAISMAVRQAWNKI